MRSGSRQNPKPKGNRRTTGDAPGAFFVHLVYILLDLSLTASDSARVAGFQLNYFFQHKIHGVGTSAIFMRYSLSHSVPYSLSICILRPYAAALDSHPCAVIATLRRATAAEARSPNSTETQYGALPLVAVCDGANISRKRVTR